MSLRLFLVTVALSASACVSSTPASPAEPVYPEPMGQSNGPTYEQYQQDSSWSGPPGGGMDPDSGYAQNPQGYPQNPQGDPQNPQYGDQNDSTPYDSTPSDSSAPDSTPADSAEGGYYGGYADPNAGYGDPNAGYGYGGATGTGDVTDSEIDTTLQPYGEWVDDGDYGRVWRPYATVVGAEFTPYDTCGTWMYTDYGWTFSCSWDWGWLPFHYGRWVYLDNSWCWTRDYTWGPGWVDWRRGNGMVGWHPRAPTTIIRDHRHEPVIIRDHRHSNDGKWTFSGDHDFGHGVRNKVDVNTGLRDTTAVAEPPRGDHRTPIAAIMHARANRSPVRTGMSDGHPTNTTTGPRDGTWNRNPAGNTWNRGQQPSVGQNGFRGQDNNWNRNQQPSVQQPGRQPQNWNRNQPSVQQPTSGNQPHYSGPRTWAPSQTGPRYNPPSQTGPRYNPPTYSGGNSPSRPTYSPPSRQSYSPTYSPPSRPSYSPPSRPSYSPPSRPSYSPPSHSSSGSFSGSHSSGGSFSGSHSSGSSGGGSHSSGSFGGGGHSGGGGHHR